MAMHYGRIQVCMGNRVEEKFLANKLRRRIPQLASGEETVITLPQLLAPGEGGKLSVKKKYCGLIRSRKINFRHRTCSKKTAATMKGGEY